MDLTNKVALVTGGSRGIGLGIARALLDAGAAVAITGTSQPHLDRAADLLGARGRLVTLQADVRKPHEVQGAFARVAEEFRGVDILVNNAGVGRFSPVADMTLEQWHQVIDTNLTGVFYCCHEAIPYLRQRGGGWIINISSLAGKNAFPEAAAYCASKAGLNAFSEALMQEVRHDGIRVSYVMPGSVSTEFGGPTGTEGDWKLTAQDIADVVLGLLAHPPRSLPSRVEIRPARPPRK
jgi:3-oxoacyl-[acyl-carrier protein] reductase